MEIMSAKQFILDTIKNADINERFIISRNLVDQDLLQEIISTCIVYEEQHSKLIAAHEAIEKVYFIVKTRPGHGSLFTR